MTTITSLTVASTQMVNSVISASPTSDTPSSTAKQAAGPVAQTSSAGTSSTKSSADTLASASAAAANSGSYSFSTVADNARTVLNAGVQKLGKSVDIYTTGAQLDQIFGNMDRRSLYAVASNQGGQFTEMEQQFAGSRMQEQLSQAAGIGPGVIVGASNFKSEVTFLQGVSAEEKQSLGWAVTMADAQTSYNITAGDSGLPPAETGTYTNPLVKALMTAMKSAQGDPSKDRSVGPQGTLAEILDQPWAKGFETQIQQGYAATIPQGGLLNVTA